MALAITMAGCAQPAVRPAPPEVTFADFQSRGACVTKILNERVKAASTETDVLLAAKIAVGYCSGDLQNKMRLREPFGSPYREIVVEQDRAQAMEYALAEARDLREERRRLHLP